MPVSRYVTLRTVKHSGSEFPVGTPMALSDDYAAPLLAIGAIQAQAGPLPSMPAVPGDVVREVVDTGSGGKARTYVEAIPSDGGVDIFDPRDGSILTPAKLGWGGGGGVTPEEVQDFMNTALAHAGHSGLTVIYDDANNRFLFTAATGGGASTLSRKLTLTVNGQMVTAVVKGTGSSADLAAATVASSLDGTSSLVLTLANVGTFKIDSVAVNVPAGANAGTSFTLSTPDLTGATTLADSGLASLSLYNDAGVVQASTSVTMAMSGSNLVVTKSGLVANTPYRFKVVY